MPKRRSTRAFKLKVVQAVESGALRLAQACRAYQIGEHVLNRWRQEVRLRGTDAAFTPLETPTAVPHYEARIAELERVCGQLVVEHAALKKALQRLPLPHGMRSC
jgi:transposase